MKLFLNEIQLIHDIFLASVRAKQPKMFKASNEETRYLLKVIC